MAFRSAAVHFLMFSPLRASPLLPFRPLLPLLVCFFSSPLSFPYIFLPDSPLPSLSLSLLLLFNSYTSSLLFLLSFPTRCLPCSVVLFRPFRFPSYFSSFPLHPPSPTSSAVSSFTSSICSPFLSQEVGGVAQW